MKMFRCGFPIESNTSRDGGAIYVQNPGYDLIHTSSQLRSIFSAALFFKRRSFIKNEWFIYDLFSALSCFKRRPRVLLKNPSSTLSLLSFKKAKGFAKESIFSIVLSFFQKIGKDLIKERSPFSYDPSSILPFFPKKKRGFAKTWKFRPVFS